jgi:hypothetical protein
MKNFAQYLAESKKTFDYRIKIVGDVPADFVRAFKDKLKKFDPEKISDMKTTPVMSKPEGFPNYPNERVNIMDCSFRYPANLQQMQQVVELLGLDVIVYAWPISNGARAWTRSYWALMSRMKTS